MWYDATVSAGTLQGADSRVKGKIGYALAPTVKKSDAGWLWAWALAIESSSKYKDQAFKFLTWATRQKELHRPDRPPGRLGSVPPGDPRLHLRESQVQGRRGLREDHARLHQERQLRHADRRSGTLQGRAVRIHSRVPGAGRENVTGTRRVPLRQRVPGSGARQLPIGGPKRGRRGRVFQVRAIDRGPACGPPIRIRKDGHEHTRNARRESVKACRFRRSSSSLWSRRFQ